MRKRYIAVLTDATAPPKSTVTVRIMYARRRYEAQRLARIAARTVFDNHAYGVNIFANVWPLDVLEEVFYDTNSGFLRASHLAIGKTVLGVADPLDTFADFMAQANKTREQALALINYIEILEPPSEVPE